MPRWASVSSVNTESTHASSLASGKSIEQSLLTTCVGSVHELKELLACINTRPLTWTPPAIQALFYFMRCSQVRLECFCGHDWTPHFSLLMESARMLSLNRPLKKNSRKWNWVTHTSFWFKLVMAVCVHTCKYSTTKKKKKNNTVKHW